MHCVEHETVLLNLVHSTMQLIYHGLAMWNIVYYDHYI